MYKLLVLLLPPVIARGPPGMRPPPTFDAETWYPSNLPTVKPPWKMPGADISMFQTPEFTDNSVTAPLITTTTTLLPPRTTSIEFQEEDEATVILSNSTVSSASSEVKEETTSIMKSMENVTSSEKSMEVADNSTLVSSVVDLREQDKGKEESSGELQNLGERKEEEQKGDTTLPFTGSDEIFDVKEKAGMENITDCSDLVFVIDSSGNVLSQFEKQKELVRLIIQALGTQRRRLGLVTYAGRKRQRWNILPQLNVTRELYLKKLKKARFLGGVTATGAVLQFLVKDERIAHSSIVLLTDGFSFDDVDEPAKELRNMATTELYVTGDYFPLVRKVLNAITGTPDRVRFGHRDIRRLIEDLRNPLKHRSSTLTSLCLRTFTFIFTGRTVSSLLLTKTRVL